MDGILAEILGVRFVLAEVIIGLGVSDLTGRKVGVCVG